MFSKRNRLISQILIIIVVDILFIKCANVSTPSGGPKDTKAPILLKAVPDNKTLNFSGNKIILKFNEPIQDIADETQILINPKQLKNPKYKVINKRNLELIFQEKLLDNTTYSINFKNSIKDINEGNVNEKELIYAFSTGKYIDSISIKGKTLEMLNNNADDKTLIALYQKTDTLNIRKHLPTYSTKTDKTGAYKLENIKADTYTIVAFNDYNNKGIYDNDNKSIDFLDNVLLRKDTTIDFFLSKIIDKKLKINNIKQINKYHSEINLSKGVKDHTLKINSLEVVSKIDKNKRKINIYNKGFEKLKDSLSLEITCIDSANVKHILEKKVIFEDLEDKKTKTKKVELQIDNKQNKGDKFDIIFTHPIEKYYLDSIKIKIDSTENITAQYKWDKNYTILTVEPKLKAEDSIIIKIPKNTFINYNHDTLDKFNSKLLVNNVKSTGLIAGEIKTEYKNLIIELLNDRNEVIKKIYSNKKFEFEKLSAGKYRLRAIIDDNDNKEWDMGELEMYIRAEKIINYDTIINLKEDWEINDIVWKL